RCYIIDAQTGDSIPFANAVYVTTKLRASSDAAGILVIGKQIGQTLTVTAVGYNARRIKITSNIGDELTIKLISQVKRLEGVVVKAKRKRKYTRKNNPAVELMRRVIA
ncbi:carboxypeptidase-like regulatory domain-containing protein, partial [Brevibacterium sp. UMB10442]|nr:carboxypeptidase-like regulatory domain-containing protein [Brevibacterium sp. UMB10442]